VPCTFLACCAVQSSNGTWASYYYISSRKFRKRYGKDTCSIISMANFLWEIQCGALQISSLSFIAKWKCSRFNMFSYMKKIRIIVLHCKWNAMHFSLGLLLWHVHTSEPVGWLCVSTRGKTKGRACGVFPHTKFKYAKYLNVGLNFKMLNTGYLNLIMKHGCFRQSGGTKCSEYSRSSPINHGGATWDFTLHSLTHSYVLGYIS
jgi:hypothetical protein